jgi:two-component system nitrate/nitrite response regulator NarL
VTTAAVAKRHVRSKQPHRGDASTAPIGLVLIDDKRMLRETLAATFDAQTAFKVLASSASVTDALHAVGDSPPDIVLLDVAVAGQHSLTVMRTLRVRLPDARVIITGLLQTHAGIADLVRAGTSGFIMRDASTEEVLETILQVASGARVLPKSLTTALFSQIVDADGTDVARRDRVMRDAGRVTAREQEVIDALAEGLSNKAIAKRMNIAVHTVKSHVHNVLEKLALNSRLEVAAYKHAASREQGDESSSTE